MSKRKKQKTTSDDFLRLLEDTEDDTSLTWSHRAPASPPEVHAKESRDKVEAESRNATIKVETKRGQTGDKAETSQDKSRDTVSNSRDKVGTQPETPLETKQRQTGDKVGTKPQFSSLIGSRRKLILFLYQESRAARSTSTEVLSIEHIAASTETTVTSAKKTLQRLEKEGYFRRTGYKDGRGGGTKYELVESVFQDLLRGESEDKVRTNQRQSRDKVEAQLETEPRTASPSSSRDSFFKERTTSTQHESEYREAWIREADLQSLEQFSVTRSLLQRCFELAPELTPEMLEDLIEAFAMHMAKSKDKPKSPRGFFIELAKQAAKGMIPLENMETPTRKALKEFVQTHEAHKEEIIQLEKQAFKLAQEAWLAQLNDEDKRTLMPETALVKINTEPHNACLRSYFAEEIWPEMRGQLLQKAPPTNA